MKSKLLKRGLPAALSACMALTMISSSAVVAMAADGDAADGQKGGYVLMNIPYDEFYEGEGVTGVDTVTTATVKTYNQTMAGGSYHSGSLNATDPDTDDPTDNAEILGITYPVYVEDLSVLEGYTEVTDASKATITVASGKSARTTKDVEGKDVLFASGDYAYYVLANEPANYKTLTVNGDEVSFSSVKNQAVADTIDSAEITYGGHYTPVNLTVADDKITDDSVVSAIIITSGESKYALRHVENIWRKTSLGWYWTDLDDAGLSGKDISNITYYLQDGSIYSYNVDLAVKENAGDNISASFSGEKAINVTGLPDDIENPKATVQTKVGRGETPVVIAEDVAVTDGKITTTDAAVLETTYNINITSDNYADISLESIYTKGGYVLMNIPYDEFFEGEGVTDVDTVTTATVKTYNQTMAGGSYHSGSLNATDPDTDDPTDNAEILGITYPVYVEDLSVLDAEKEVTDASKATISVATGKSTREAKEVTGKDVLFASGNYAYYKLGDAPANYKTLTVNGDEVSFSSVKNQAVADEIESAEITYGGHYTPVNLTVADDKIGEDAVVSAIIITSGENKYALRHVENIWRKTSLGWYWTDLDEAGLAGKNISNITYYLQDGSIYSYDVDLTVKKNAGDEITAAFSGEKAIDVTGLPDDIENPKATVQTKVGRGETPVVIAENVAVTDGKITTTDAAVCETTYTVTVVSDNYADISTDVIFADKHTWNDGEVTTAATCTKEGVKTFTCSVCGETKTEEIAATGHVWNGGVVTKEPTCTEEGVKTYTCSKCGEKRTETVSKLAPKHTFTDVPNSGNTAQFYNEITWMADEGYSTGWEDGTFRPWNTINRAAVVTFLWRMNGSPAPKKMATFSDMTGNADFDKAISWAAERGITTGYSDNTFRPWEPCNRAAIVTFIWRAEGKSTGFTSKFSDKTGNSDFDTAIAWAAANGITNGFSDGTFRPWDTCKRAAVAAFLYRTK